jgi:uncharacterized membrane protein YhdT
MANIMEIQQQPLETVNSGSSEGLLALEGTNTAKIPKLPPAKEPDSQWQQISQQVVDFLAQLPTYLGRFFDQNKQALLTFGLILSALVTVKVAIAVLDALNGIPLLASIFEMVGIIYAIWFTFRYLVKAQTRQELAQNISLFKQQLLG